MFQDTRKNNALSSKVLDVKFDRFLQKMNESSTREYIYTHMYKKYSKPGPAQVGAISKAQK